MVLDKDWKYMKKVDKEKAKQIREHVLDDGWGELIDYIIYYTELMVNMLRVADIDKPILHLVYDIWDTTIEEVKVRVFKHEKKDVLTMRSDFFKLLHEILVERWNKSLTSLHCVAHSLNPKYYTPAWLEEGDNGVKRVAPNQDAEVAKNRTVGFMRLFPADVLRNTSSQFGKFYTSSGYFSKLNVMVDRDSCEPREWWGMHGFSAPILQRLANRLLCQPTSSSSYEINWSTYSKIHNIKLNKLDCGRAEDLVYVHTNIRLLSRRKSEYTVGPSKHWDVAMDDEFSLERGKGFHTLDNEDEILLSFDGGDGMGEEAPNPTSRDASSSGKGKDVEDLIDDSDEE